MTHDTISFLSDYGRADEFVGVVHSVIRSIAPDVAVIDISHDIAPHDIRAGGLTLARAAQYLVPGVVLAVVDPGVGTARRAIAVEVGDGESTLVGPDNGLLAPVVALVGGATRAVELTNAEFRLDAPGATFDGRDVFAPAAAHLCRGVDLGELGPGLDPATLVPGMLPVPRIEPDQITGEVLWVDRFGNAQLNLDPDDIPEHWDPVRLRVGELSRALRRESSFAAIGAGQVGLVLDSYGLLAVALDRGSAAVELGLAPGTEVVLEPTDADAPTAAGGGSSPVRLSPRPGSGAPR